MIRTDQIHVAMTKMSEPVLVLPCQSNALIGTLKENSTDYNVAKFHFKIWQHMTS